MTQVARAAIGQEKILWNLDLITLEIPSNLKPRDLIYVKPLQNNEKVQDLVSQYPNQEKLFCLLIAANT